MKQIRVTIWRPSKTERVLHPAESFTNLLRQLVNPEADWVS